MVGLEDYVFCLLRGNSIAMVVDLTYVIPNVCVGGWYVSLSVTE